MTTMQDSSQKYDDIKIVLQNWATIVKKYSQPDTKKAVWQMILSFLPYIALWIAMYFSYSYSYLLCMFLAFLNAFFLVRIFIIQHDCGHFSFLKNRKVNNIIGNICSVLSLIPYKYWSKSHSLHHANNGKLEVRDIGDLDFLTVEEYQKLGKFKQFMYRVYRSVPVMFFIIPVYYMFIHNRLPLIKLPSFKDEIRPLMLNNITIILFYLGVGYLVGFKAFLMVQIPIWIFFGMIAIWFFYVQHQHEETYKAWKSNWEYLLSALKGSTFYDLPKWMHWLTGNIGYHHIHHLNSFIPNYNLAKCHEENPVFHKYVVRMGFFESFKCAMNKLWDEQTQRMITFSEYRKMYKK